MRSPKRFYAGSCTVSWLTRSCFYAWPFAMQPVHHSVLKVLIAVYHNIRYNINMSKKKTSIRLSEEAQRLIAQLSTQLGISQSAVLELAIRALAKQEEIPPHPK